MNLNFQSYPDSKNNLEDNNLHTRNFVQLFCRFLLSVMIWRLGEWCLKDSWLMGGCVGADPHVLERLLSFASNAKMVGLLETGSLHFLQHTLLPGLSWCAGPEAGLPTFSKSVAHIRPIRCLVTSTRLHCSCRAPGPPATKGCMTRTTPLRLSASSPLHPGPACAPSTSPASGLPAAPSGVCARACVSLCVCCVCALCLWCCVCCICVRACVDVFAVWERVCAQKIGCQRC